MSQNGGVELISWKNSQQEGYYQQAYKAIINFTL